MKEVQESARKNIQPLCLVKMTSTTPAGVECLKLPREPSETSGQVVDLFIRRFSHKRRSRKHGPHVCYVALLGISIHQTILCQLSKLVYSEARHNDAKEEISEQLLKERLATIPEDIRASICYKASKQSEDASRFF